MRSRIRQHPGRIVPFAPTNLIRIVRRLDRIAGGARVAGIRIARPGTLAQRDIALGVAEDGAVLAFAAFGRGGVEGVGVGWWCGARGGGLDVAGEVGCDAQRG